MATSANLDEILELTDRLPLLDKVRLIERLAPRIARDVQATTATPRRSLRGLWKGLDITDEDIAEARREMWSNFPREDV